MSFHMNDNVVVRHKGYEWAGIIVNVAQHSDGHNYYVESKVNHHRGWYSSNLLKKLDDPNFLLKNIL